MEKVKTSESFLLCFQEIYIRFGWMKVEALPPNIFYEHWFHCKHPSHPDHVTEIQCKVIQHQHWWQQQPKHLQRYSIGKQETEKILPPFFSLDVCLFAGCCTFFLFLFSFFFFFFIFLSFSHALFYKYINIHIENKSHKSNYLRKHTYTHVSQWIIKSDFCF